MYPAKNLSTPAPKYLRIWVHSEFIDRQSNIEKHQARAKWTWFHWSFFRFLKLDLKSPWINL
jgi:hypothetical protein